MMKRVYVLFVVAFFLLVATACYNSNNVVESGNQEQLVQASAPILPTEEGVVYIPEESFYMKVLEISFNPEFFLGRTLRYEGMFRTVFWEGWETEDGVIVEDEYIHHVYRTSFDGCCTSAEFLGFEVYIGNLAPPENNAWVEVTGVFEELIVDGLVFYRLNVTNLVELEERGLEDVTGMMPNF